MNTLTGEIVADLQDRAIDTFMDEARKECRSMEDVLAMVHAFEEANGIKIPYTIAGRREGDVPYCVADPTKANTVLNWHAEKTVIDMCRDAWRW